MTMAFAIEEINKHSSLLPNVTLGYSLYDNCATLGVGFSAALSLASGQEEQAVLQPNCSGAPPVLGIVGDSFSTFCIATSSVLGLFKLPIVSFSELDCFQNYCFYCYLEIAFSLFLQPLCFIVGELFCHMFLSE